MQTAPGGFQFLHIRVMQYLIQLAADKLVDLRDAMVDHRHRIASYRHPFIKNLRRQFFQHVTRVGLLELIARHPPFLDNAIQHA